MSDINVTVQEDDLIGASTSLYNPPTISKLQDVGDIDVATQGKLDGSVLVYDASTDKWVSTKKLEKQLVNGGFF
jgi:hypothetical protein